MAIRGDILSTVKYVLKLTAGVAVSTLILGGGADSLSNTYFDPGDVAPAGGSPVVLVAGDTQYVREASVQVRAYFTLGYGALTIAGAGFCEDDDYDQRYSGGASLSVGTNVTRFTVESNPRSIQTQYGRMQASGSATGDGCGAIGIAVEGMRFDNNLGLYYADIKADGLLYGYQNGFRVTARNRGDSVSRGVVQAGQNGQHNVTMQQAGRSPERRTYRIRFGSDCTIKTGTPASITFYDADNNNGDGSGAQIGWMSMRLEQTLPNGVTSDIPLSGPYEAPESAGGSSTRYIPTTASSSYETIQFTAQPGARYVLVLENVYYNNTIQFSTPFDGIFNNPPCPVGQAWTASVNTQATVTSSSQGLNPNNVTWRAATQNASVGQRVYWMHNFSITGSGYVSNSEQYRITRDYDGATGNWTNIGGVSNYRYFSALRGVSSNLGDQVLVNNALITNAHIGRTLCNGVEVSRASSTNANNISSESCIRVAADYILTPTLDQPADPVVQEGVDTFTVQRMIRHSGSTPSRAETRWELTRTVIASGQLPNDVGLTDNTNTPCSHYQVRLGGSSCSRISEGTGTILSSGLTGSFPDNIRNYPIGTRICYGLSVLYYRTTSGPNDWRHAAPICIVIGKIPAIHVWGNDVRVGSRYGAFAAQQAFIRSSLTSIGGDLRGSWGEYGVIAPIIAGRTASVNSFASGSGANNGDATLGDRSSWSRLTFANANANNLGQFKAPAALAPIPNIGDYFRTTRGIAPVGNISVSSWTADRVIVSTGTVTITSDIAKDASSLQQMVIIARNINIEDDVRQVDAWLIAEGGDVNTCSNGDYRTVGGCNLPLVINGPVVADEVIARRTGGGNETPAETVNLRGDAYIWAYEESKKSGTWHTVYSTELPPRF